MPWLTLSLDIHLLGWADTYVPFSHLHRLSRPDVALYRLSGLSLQLTSVQAASLVSAVDALAMEFAGGLTTSAAPS